MCQDSVQIIQSEVAVTIHNNHERRQSRIAQSTPLDFLLAILASVGLKLIYAENDPSSYKKKCVLPVYTISLQQEWALSPWWQGWEQVKREFNLIYVWSVVKMFCEETPGKSQAEKC